VRVRTVVLYLFAVVALLTLVVVGVRLGRTLVRRSQVLDSGGPLSALEAAYDVRRYDLEIGLDPPRRALSGRLVATVTATSGLARFEIDLDRRLRISEVRVDDALVPFSHDGGKILAEPPRPWSAGERHRVSIRYAGRPKISSDPPWIDGFVWAEAPSGQPWVGVTDEIDGADDWWPAKDHPSDEPDEGMSITLTVPKGLLGLSNGRRIDQRTETDGATTSRWEVHAPINNYLVTVAAGPYVELTETYHGADGALAVPMSFWVLPEHRDAALRLWREAPRALEILARRFGEFPFLADKIGAVEAPFDGMEHQTLIALGDGLVPGPSGRYDVLVHELAHEWWGNKVTARDWDDFWIHEGFATYAEVLYVEAVDGAAAARDDLELRRIEIRNERPLTAGRTRTAAEAYEDDIYDKGAWVLATLRWQIGDDAFFRFLRRFSGDPPSACRLVDSAEVERLAEEESGRDLGWFWERYLRRAGLPRWRESRQRGTTTDQVCFRWSPPGFELALPLRVGATEPSAVAPERLEMPGGEGCLEVPSGTPVVVDPAGRILAEPAPAGG